MFSFKKLLARLFPNRLPLRYSSSQLSLEQLETREVPATLLWIGGKGEGAAKTDWSNVADWKVLAVENIPADANLVVNDAPNRSPVATDTVEFTAASTTSCLINANSEVASLIIDGLNPNLNVNPNTGTLTVHGGLLNTLTLDTKQYSIGGESNLIIASGATFTWKSGTMATHKTGQTIVQAGATLNIESSNDATKDARLAGRTLVIQAAPVNDEGDSGRVNFTSGSIYFQKDPIEFANAASIVNRGAFTMSGTASGFAAAQSSDGYFVNNANATLDLAQSASIFSSSVQFENGGGGTSTGNVLVESGNLVFQGLTFSTGTFGTSSWQVAQNQYISFRTDPTQAVRDVALTGSNSFSGLGQVRIDGARVYLDNSNVSFQTLVITGGGLFSGVGAAAQQVAVNTLIWTSGTIKGTITLTLPQNGGAIISQQAGEGTPAPALQQATIVNQGLIILGQSAWGGTVLFAMGDRAKINNTGQGVMTIVDSSAILDPAGQTPGFIEIGKNAKLMKPSNSGVSVLQVGISSENGAPVILAETTDSEIGYDIQSWNGQGWGPWISVRKSPSPNGQMGFLGPLDSTQPAGTLPDGKLFGSGTVTTALFTNAGTVQPDDAGAVGSLTFVGNYTQTASGVLALALGGGNTPIAGTDYDQIVVSNGQLTLGGSLQLSILPTLSAQAGTIFTLIDDNESSLPLTTTFANLPDGSQISVAGWVFEINYKSTTNTDGTYHNTVTLTVVSTPQTSTNTASVSGLVWVDQNRDGIDNSGEPTAAGIAVTLIDMTTGNSTRTVTDSNGAYTFQPLAAGSYEVQFDPTANSTYANYRFTTNNADSLAIPSTGITAPFTLSNSQQLTNINAGLVSNAPPVGIDDSYTVNRNGSLNVSATAGVLSNDTDAANESLTAALVSGPQNGTLSLNADGSFSYIPNTNFVGTDSFSYQPVDASGPGSVAYVTITVTEPSPVANATSASTNMDSSVTINVLANASDSDGDTLTVTDASGAQNGETGINPDGSITYKPNDGFIGTDSFTVTISDGYGGTVSATVTVTVNPVTGQPVADTEEVTTSQDTATEVDLSELASDTNSDSSNLTYTVGDAQNGTVALLADGHTVEFTPDANYQGYASFTFTATDSTTGRSDSGTITVSVNSSPTAANLNVSTNEGCVGCVWVLFCTSNRNGDTLSVATLDGANGKAGVNPDGTITYDPAKGWYGTDSFTYAVYDAFGGVAFATVTVTVNPLPPTANTGSLTTQQGTPVSIDLSSLASDVNMPSANLTYSVSSPQGGTVALSADGHTVQFIPANGFTGQAQFTYTVTDPTTGLSASSTVTVTVNSSGGTGNTPPLATGYTATASSSPITLSIQALASDPNGYALTIISVTAPTYGIVSIASDGQSLTYSGPYPASQTDSFTYTVSDGHGGTATGTITIYP